MGEEEDGPGERSPSPEWNALAGETNRVSRSTVVEEWEACVEALGTDSQRSMAVLRGVAALAGDDPDAAEHTIVDVAPYAASGATNVRQQATLVLARLAEHHPESVAAAVDHLGVTIANAPDLPSRRRATTALARVATADPEAVARVADSLVPLLEGDDDFLREDAALALGRLAHRRSLPVDLDLDVDDLLPKYAAALGGRFHRAVRVDALEEGVVIGEELDDLLATLTGCEDLRETLSVILDAVDVAAEHGGVAPEPLRDQVAAVAERAERVTEGR
ncbi:HEAT repeat domain-containing protein [Haloarchaeobius sp. DT45]|uniref:HEAT repeat domain-containing protein n=1 Tax=Haloarchaeobius sp. DT45 TaxID=3446116 RepID=UPI003F6BBF74